MNSLEQHQTSQNKKLDFDEWLMENEDDLYIEAAETGADREFCYNSEDYYEEKYTQYLESL